MKRILLTLSLAAMLFSAKAQIIITGVMQDPIASDASVTAGVKAYEYAQFKATENIDFSINNFSVVFLYETTTTPLPNNGWNSGSQGLTYQFNLTSGTVNKGEYFYVGGDGKKLTGSNSVDISSANWIRTIDYAKSVDDRGDGTSKTGLIGNSNRANAVAVFATTAVIETTTPIDVVFLGAPGVNHYDAGPPEKGFRITDNDLYALADSEFFNKSANTKTIPTTTTTMAGAFMQLGGDYNTTTKKWDSPRTPTFVTVSNTSTLSDIETGAGTTTLPVSLTTFTAKANKAGTVNLAWSTASETNNSHFEITRSTDGVNFTKVGQVAGSGNSNKAQHYNYTDSKPASGNNYYRLKQVDHDGKSELSQIVVANVGFGVAKMTVAASANRSSVIVNYEAISGGQAIFTIYNVSGVKVTTVSQTVVAGANQINIPAALNGSMHILKASQGGVVASAKF